MTPRVWGLGTGDSLHSPDTLASRIGFFWELGLWIPNGVCVLEAARALKSCPFSLCLSSWALRREDPTAGQGYAPDHLELFCNEGVFSIFLLLPDGALWAFIYGQSPVFLLLYTPKRPETWVSSPVLKSLGMAPGHCRTGFGP